MDEYILKNVMVNRYEMLDFIPSKNLLSTWQLTTNVLELVKTVLENQTEHTFYN